jgi:hypothetical protein
MYESKPAMKCMNASGKYMKVIIVTPEAAWSVPLQDLSNSVARGATFRPMAKRGGMVTYPGKLPSAGAFLLRKIEARNALTDRAAKLGSDGSDLMRNFGNILRDAAIGPVNRRNIAQAHIGDIGNIGCNQIHGD